jgi:hypothetical protein
VLVLIATSKTGSVSNKTIRFKLNYAINYSKSFCETTFLVSSNRFVGLKSA